MRGPAAANWDPPVKEPLSVACWGVRGTAPVSGKDVLAFGGDTQCIEIFCGDSRVIIDAGSGLLGLGRELAHKRAPRVDILLTHFHLDHVMGLMSFAPLFQRGTVIRLHAPILEAGPPRIALARFLDTPFFPFKPEEAGADFAIRAFRPGARFDVGGMQVSTCGLNHPGGACGYRIENGGRSVAVVADHEHGVAETDMLLGGFCAGADLLLYDAHWDEDIDYEAHRGWGHSTWQAGERLRVASGARRLGCLHHPPSATDSMLLQRQNRLSAAHPAGVLLRQGDLIRLTGGALGES